MKVKELKEILNSYPDDMEVMNYDEVSGPFSMQTPSEETLQLIQHHEWNSKEHEWQRWSFPSRYALYKADLIKEEKCLVFGYY